MEIIIKSFTLGLAVGTALVGLAIPIFVVLAVWAILRRTCDVPYMKDK